MNRSVYLDYNASTPIDEQVLERMLPYFGRHYGNPSSKGHSFGIMAGEAVEQAREQLAALIGADPSEIVFTSGATEAANTAIKGVARAYASKGKHIVSVATEHRAVLNSCRALERQGCEVTYLTVDREARLDLNHLEDSLRDDTILVCAMWANNEVGTIHPIAEISRIVRSRGVLLMTDATQAVGKVPVDSAGVDLLACSGHKFYGPKGVGALYVRRRDPRVRLAPLLDGGGHEDGRRSGTLNVPGIVALGAAAEIAAERQEDDRVRLRALRDRLEAGLTDLPQAHLNVSSADRLPQTTSIRFEGIRAANVMMNARELALSAGSACSSGNGLPSHVLTAMGLSEDQALSTLRISLGRLTTEEDVDYAVGRLREAVTAPHRQTARAS